MTVREALKQIHTRLDLQEALRDRALADARQLVGMATGRTYTAMLAYPDAELTGAEEQALESLLQRRLHSEPIQYLRGTQEFYGRDFVVGRDVLIPRPETEDVITTVLESVRDREAPLRIADVGTGSGALAATLAAELPQSRVTAYDISAPALAVARRNCVRLGVQERVRLVESDLFGSASAQDLFDIVVSNPPYIAFSEAADLHPEVREWEPHGALFAAEDGLAIYRRLIPEARHQLVPGGLLVMETGGKIDLLLRWLDEWNDVHVRADLQSIPRVVSARRNKAIPG